MSHLIRSENNTSISSLENYVNNVALEEEWEVGFEELHITTMIGQGGFGCVRSAIWRGTEVALKVLKDRTIDPHEFYMEIKILTRLHHPNILQVLGCCTQRMPFAIVLEYMHHGSLEQFVKRRTSKKYRLSDNQKFGIIKDIARGISYLHNRKPIGIIHRDLKPSNILLSQGFTAKIADFGISALKSTPAENYAHTGETGTYRYMAPEVLKSQYYNCKVDIWSFGMLVYAMFVEIPFTGFGSDMMYSAILGDPFKWLSLKSIKHDHIVNLIQKTVTPDPDYRWDATYMVNFCNASLDDCQETKKKLKKIGCCVF